MGLFSKLKAQIEAAQAAGNAMAGVAPVSDIPELVAPWPQEEVDRLLQGPGPIRAIVVRKQHQILQDGEHVGRMRVDLTVRVRGPEGTLYEPVKLRASVSSWVASLIEKGLDVPVERDPATGAPTRIASKQLTAELSHRKEEADQIRPRWGLDPDVQGVIETAEWARDKLRGDDPSPTPDETR